MRKTLHPFLLLTSFGLIMAPIGNFGISFHMHGIDGWYRPAIFLHLASQIQSLDWIWNGALVFSGILILLRTKISWAFAVLAISFASAVNLHKFFYEPDPNFGSGHLAMSLMGSTMALLVVYFFRFPHLDRRDHWLNIHRRKRVHLQVEVSWSSPEGHQCVVGKIENISKRGMLLKLEKELPTNLSLRQALLVKCPEYEGAIEVQMISQRPEGLGVSITHLTSAQKSWLEKTLG